MTTPGRGSDTQQKGGSQNLLDTFYHSGSAICLLMAVYWVTMGRARGPRAWPMALAFLLLAGIMQMVRAEAPAAYLVMAAIPFVLCLIADVVIRSREAAS